MKRLLVIIIASLVVLIGCSSNYVDQRDRSPHFVDGKFRNANHEEKSLWSAISMWWNTPFTEWPEWIKTDHAKAPDKQVTGKQIKVTVINHATVLIQGAGYNVLTDPVYSKRVSPVSFAGPARVRDPAIRFDDLPKIDVIVISHDHYDHLDLKTIAKLVKRDKSKVYVGLGVGRHLASMDTIIEMDWWEKADIAKDFSLSFVPVQHFSGRGLFDRFSTLWGGYVLELAGKKIYFGGDSGYADHYKETFKKFGAMDLSFIPIGAYEPRWFMKYVHMNPEEAVKAHLDLKSKKSIGIHYGTFQLTAEGIDEPVKMLAEERKKAGLPDDAFITMEFGEGLQL